MADMIGLHSFHNRSAIERLTDHFHVFDLDVPPNVALGEACTVFGFPVVEGAADWPSYPVRTCAGRVVARTTEMLRVDRGVERGYSGGPVINTAGQLIGMAIGEDGGLASVVSVEALAVL